MQMKIYEINFPELNAYKEKHGAEKALKHLAELVGINNVKLTTRPTVFNQTRALCDAFQVFAKGICSQGTTSDIQQGVWGESQTREKAFENMFERLKNPSSFITDSSCIQYENIHLTTAPKKPTQEKKYIHFIYDLAA